MAIGRNQEVLINALQREEALDDRYESLECVNVEGQRRGVLSLVFRAHDRIDGAKVAIKFFDPERLNNQYRLDCFNREPKILARLKGKRRALQLKSDLSHYTLTVPDGHGGSFDIPHAFFVTEWVDDDVDQFFYDSEAFETSTKLLLFRSIVLAVQTVHHQDLFHRDLKIDNIRLRTKAPEILTAIIDFGTAASIASGKITDQYDGPVGAQAFAAPECFVGLAGTHSLCQKADIYSLGSLFFDLFEIAPFYVSRNQDTAFETVVHAIIYRMQHCTRDSERLAVWNSCMHDLRFQVGAPRICGEGSSIPKSISELSKKLYDELTAFDFRRRESCFPKIIDRIDKMLAILAHEENYQKKLSTRRVARLVASR